MSLWAYIKRRSDLAVSISGFWRYTLKRNLRIYLRNRINRYRYSDSLADPYKYIYVNPTQITEVYTATISCRGAIKAGNWDKSTRNLEECVKIKAVKEHFKKGTDWEETGIYEYMLDRIEEKGIFDGCRTKEDIRSRYEDEIESLYRDIKENGYKSQVELGNTEPDKPGKNEPRVNIGRDGEVIFASGGWHRMAIAQILELEEIPTQVMIRHKKWQELREEIANTDSYSELSDSALSNITHPDLQDIVPQEWLKKSMDQRSH